MLRAAGLIASAALVLGLPAIAAAQTTAENLGKYHALRARLLDEFTRIGDAPGQSQPAEHRNDAQGYAKWADSTIRLGWYLSVLATEHHLLANPSRFPGADGGDGSAATKTLDELYYALRAMERLDEVADEAFPPPCTQQKALNGFFLRDDVPGDFHQNFPPLTATQSDFVDPVLTNKEMSQDQVYHVLLGLAAVKRFVSPGTIHQGKDLNAWTVEQATRIVQHVSSHNWVITNPACGDRDVERGPLASGYSHGTRAAIDFITDGAYLPEVNPALAGVWEISRDPNAPQYLDEDNLHMSMTIAAVGNGWGDTTASDLAALSEKHDWPLYPLLHRALHGDAAAGFCATGEKLNQRARTMLDELPTGAEPKSPLPGGPAVHGFGTSNRFIRGKDQAYGGSPNSEGQRYNGLDFLLLHNLYAIATPATWQGGDGPGVPECSSLPDSGTDGGGGGSGSGGSAGSSASPAESDDGGCGCRAASRGATGASWPWLAALAVAALGRRARRVRLTG